MKKQETLKLFFIFYKQKKLEFWNFIYELIGFLGMYDFLFKHFYRFR